MGSEKVLVVGGSMDGISTDAPGFRIFKPIASPDPDPMVAIKNPLESVLVEIYHLETTDRGLRWIFKRTIEYSEMRA